MKTYTHWTDSICMLPVAAIIPALSALGTVAGAAGGVISALNKPKAPITPHPGPARHSCRPTGHPTHQPHQHLWSILPRRGIRCPPGQPARQDPVRTMISVPTSTGAAPTPTPATSGPDEVYLMMAAAQMHKEGRLIATGQYGEPDAVKSTNDNGTKLDQKPEPQKYFPSSGDRTGPAMMT